MSQGKVMGVLPPGQHTLDATELPFLGMFIDWASKGNAFKAELLLRPGPASTRACASAADWTTSRTPCPA